LTLNFSEEPLPIYSSPFYLVVVEEVEVVEGREAAEADPLAEAVLAEAGDDSKKKMLFS
jgi:hypothetical protein